MFRLILFAYLMSIVIGQLQGRKNFLDRTCGYNMKANKNNKRLREPFNSASFSEFPWTVIVLHETQKNVFYYECDGSLIHPQVVLTVADCALKLTPGKTFIRAGEKDSLSKKLNNPQNRNVREIIIHNDFNNTTMDNNFALIVLEEPFNTDAENVDIVCLPKSLKENYVGEKCKISIIERIQDNNLEESTESNDPDDFGNVDNLSKSNIPGNLDNVDNLKNSNGPDDSKNNVDNLNKLEDSEESDIPDYLDKLIEFYEPEESAEVTITSTTRPTTTTTTSTTTGKQIESDTFNDSSNINILSFDLVIKTAGLEIVNNDKCMKKNNYKSKLSNSFICGNSKERLHLCEAIKGSAIVCPHPDDSTRWVHVGLFAVKCDDPFVKQTDIYVNVAKARKWIDQTINDLRAKPKCFIDY